MFKKTRTLLFAAFAFCVAGCYDDSQLWDSLNDHEVRILKLETICNQINTNISSLEAIVSALQNNDFVTSVSPITENGKEIGYTITFSKSGSITIYHGKNGSAGIDGEDGMAPVIGVKQDIDGVWYWTINGVWLLDEGGNMIPAMGNNGSDGKPGTDGKDGVTPQLKIEDYYWYISYDNGSSWTQLGKAVGENGINGKDGVDGDTLFSSVTQDENGVHFVLSDGTIITIPAQKELTIIIEQDEVAMEDNGCVIIPFTIYGAEDSVRVSAIAEGPYETKVESSENNTGTITVTTSGTAENGKVLVFVSCRQLTIMKEITIVGPYDLSEFGTANCYIVSAAGKYKFTPSKGNSNGSIEDISSVEVLWETFGTEVTPNVGDLITNVQFKGGYIAFETPELFVEGNAAIAAKDINGTILWSWHIWLTDKPQEHIYSDLVGTMMDRNLGAISAVPEEVGACGLFYQWGRKDPFIGSSPYTIQTSTNSTITWPTHIETSSSVGTIDYTITHPTTFIIGTLSEYDWHFWHDTTLWMSEKSAYDPCPAGWRVPDGSIWEDSNFINMNFEYNSEGLYFNIVSPSVTWYPRGSYWTNSAYTWHAISLVFNNGSLLTESKYAYREDGHFVRCFKE